jgi:heat shock protein HslJ
MMKTGMVSRVVGLAGFVASLAACGGSALGPAGPTSPGGAMGGDVVAQGVQPLVGTWRAVSVKVGGAETVVPQSVTLTAQFAADGRLNLVADCNRCAAGYSAAPGTLSVTPMACTRAYCSSAPLDEHFASLVSAATSWSATAHTLDLECSAGSVHLQR